MTRGRDKFKRFAPVLHCIVVVFSFLPKRIREKMLIYSRKVTGYRGLILRYVILKTLAKSLGENVSIHPDVYLFNVHKLECGNNVSIHPMTYIEAWGGVFIGNDVSIAHGVTIMSVNHGFSQAGLSIKDQPVEPRPMSIEDNVWIGAKATILGNITIKSGAVIGAASVVTKSTTENAVVVGVPARMIKLTGVERI